MYCVEYLTVQGNVLSVLRLDRDVSIIHRVHLIVYIYIYIYIYIYNLKCKQTLSVERRRTVRATETFELC